MKICVNSNNGRYSTTKPYSYGYSSVDRNDDYWFAMCKMTLYLIMRVSTNVKTINYTYNI